MSIGLDSLLKLEQPCSSCKYNRARMLDWMLEVLSYYPECRSWECYFHCAGVFDGYLLKQADVDASEIHLIGLACIFVGMKAASFKHPTLAELLRDACSSKYSVEAVKSMEVKLLEVIQYRAQPSPIYKAVFRINSHCLVDSAYIQNGISLRTVLQLCF